MTRVIPVWKAVHWLTVAGLLLAGFVLLHGAGNATQGYISTHSAWVWWGIQWFNPGSDLEHVPLLILGVVGLAVRNWRAWHHLPNGPAWRIGMALCFLALLLNLGGWFVQQTRISLIAGGLWLWGVGFWMGGERMGRAMAIPLVFLSFGLPLAFLMHEVGFNLRLAVLALAQGLSELGGIDITRSGTLLTSADGSYVYDVAPACAGTRSLLILMALSAGVGYLVFRTWWRRGILLGFALPFAFAGNVLRILLIILAAEWWGPAAGDFVHEWFGFVIFLTVLALALLLVSGLERFLPEPSLPRVWPRPWLDQRAGGGALMYWLSSGGAVVLGLLVTTQVLWASHERSRPIAQAGIVLADDGIAPRALPRLVDFTWLGYDVPVSPIEREILPPDTGFARMLYQDIGGDEVFLSIVLSGADRSSIHRPELCLVGQGWSITERRLSSLQFDEGTLPVTLLELERRNSDGGQRTLFAYWFVYADGVVATDAERVWRDLWERVQGRPHRWAYVVAQTSFDGDLAAARARLEKILSHTLAEFQRAPLRVS